jgi:hypothetical protein
MSWLASLSKTTFCASTGAQKLGQPEPDSNFVSELKSGCPQQTQANVPPAFE